MILAVSLAAKMTSYVEGEEAVFRERCQAEAEELAGDDSVLLMY